MYDSRGGILIIKYKFFCILSTSLQSFFPPQAAAGPLSGYLMKSGEFMYSLMADRFYREGKTQGELNIVLLNQCLYRDTAQGTNKSLNTANPC